LRKNGEMTLWDGQCVGLLAKSKSITLNTALSKEQQPVLVDVSLIERVLQNLIDSALKFTRAGGRNIIQNSKAKRGIEVLVIIGWHYWYFINY
jgi:signal transduction histidine kinase